MEGSLQVAIIRGEGGGRVTPGGLSFLPKSKKKQFPLCLPLEKHSVLTFQMKVGKRFWTPWTSLCFRQMGGSNMSSLLIPGTPGETDLAMFISRHSPGRACLHIRMTSSLT